MHLSAVGAALLLVRAVTAGGGAVFVRCDGSLHRGTPAAACGSEQAPCTTVSDGIRVASAVPGGAEVRVAGLCFLGATASPPSGVVITSWEGEPQPTLSAGCPVANWSRTGPAGPGLSAWEGVAAHCGFGAGGAVSAPRQLWLPQPGIAAVSAAYRRAVWARQPNIVAPDSHQPPLGRDGHYSRWRSAFGPAWPAKPTPTSTFGLQLSAGDTKALRCLQNASVRNDAIVSVSHSWTFSKHRVAAFDPVSGNVTFEQGPSPLSWMGGSGASNSHFRYYVSGVPCALDAAYEWVFDRDSSRVTLLLPDGLAPPSAGSSPAVVSRLPVAVSFDGVRAAGLRGVSVSHTAWAGECPVAGGADPKGSCDGQAAAFLRTGAVVINGSAAATTLAGVDVASVGGYAVFAPDSSGTTIDRLRTSDVGGGGVRLGDTSSTLRSVGAVVSNSTIVNGSWVFEAGQGVLLHHGSDNRIVHNEVAFFRQLGVSVGWTWTYTPQRDSAMTGTLVAKNHLHDLGRNVTSDMGGVYSLGNQSADGVTPGLVVRSNRIERVISLSYGGWGTYADQGSVGVLYEGNLVVATKCAPLNVHWGQRLWYRNNVFVSETSVSSGGVCAGNGVWKTQPTQGATCGSPDNKYCPVSYNASRNVFVADSGVIFGRVDSNDLTASSWADPYQSLAFDENLYFARAMDAKALPWPPGNGTFAQWQGRGLDVHSVIADPLFANPAAGDYSLLPGSPALRIGIQQLDIADVGPLPA